MAAPLRLVSPDASHRYAARVWLRGELGARRKSDVATAAELLVSLDLRARPTPAALAWLRAKATEGKDAVRKSWARTLLEELGG